ncbi:hypothetical protein CHS0354_010647 [Potamilus streckersoni]|uniref:Uncharacterized protein n=1 Tax=Potamilus streckersoni TaxID=2493646 RepID=A0AAE0TD18_9BIVA|nr:hypothetical protein CHS0354_010647 [Potamilus streckersoni]
MATNKWERIMLNDITIIFISMYHNENVEDNEHAFGARSGDLKFVTIKKGAHDGKRHDSYDRNTSQVPERVISSRTDNLVKTKHTFITAKIEKRETPHQARNRPRNLALEKESENIFQLDINYFY